MPEAVFQAVRPFIELPVTMEAAIEGLENRWSFTKTNWSPTSFMAPFSMSLLLSRIGPFPALLLVVAVIVEPDNTTKPSMQAK